MEHRSDSATQIAYDGIRRMIFVTHELRPGQKLVESTIAQKLSISRTPVREAIHRLQQDGLLERIPNRGSFVCVPRKEQIIRSYEIVAALSAMSCYLIAERAGKGEDLHVIFDALDDACDAMEASACEGNRETWLMLDRDFHFYISANSGNERMNELYRHAHEMLFHEVWNSFPQQLINAEDSCRGHREIVRMMKEGSAPQAQMLAVDHMLNNRKRVEEQRV